MEEILLLWAEDELDLVVTTSKRLWDLPDITNGTILRMQANYKLHIERRARKRETKVD